MKKYLFVIATPKTEEEFRPLWNLHGLNLYKEKENSNVEVVYENKQGLSVVYNRYLNSNYSGYRIVFIHDDLILEDQFIIEKLNKAHEKFNVVGLAGAKQFRFKMPAMWHLMAELEDGENHLRGFVAHRMQDGRTITNFYGMGDQRVALIDGLFMSVDIDSILPTPARFDENYDFHFYDITFSLNCIMHNLSIGIPDPIFVTHLSGGKPNQNFMRLQQRFLAEYQQKWNLEKQKRGVR